MKCPKCKKEIDCVNVFSECVQVGELRGNVIEEYGGVEEISATIKIECSECLKDITKYVEEWE